MNWRKDLTTNMSELKKMKSVPSITCLYILFFCVFSAIKQDWHELSEWFAGIVWTHFEKPFVTNFVTETRQSVFILANCWMKWKQKMNFQLVQWSSVRNRSTEMLGPCFSSIWWTSMPLIWCMLCIRYTWTERGYEIQQLCIKQKENASMKWLCWSYINFQNVSWQLAVVAWLLAD